jgi:hypothetical protein
MSFLEEARPIGARRCHAGSDVVIAMDTPVGVCLRQNPKLLAPNLSWVTVQCKRFNKCEAVWSPETQVETERTPPG